MKMTLTVLLILSLWQFGPSPATAVPPITLDELKEHVEYLADPAREGRGLGTAGIDSAAQYIAREFSRAGLKPAGPGGTYFQPFNAHLKHGDYPTRNVVGMLPGNRLHPKNYVVLGAHYDHLGYGLEDSTPLESGDVHPGADDNASGVAALLELAEYFAAKHSLDRSLIFVAFSGEETGLLGSAYFVDHPTFPLEQALAMVNLDAVGRPDSGEVTLFGVQTAAEFDSLLAVANTDRLRFKKERGGIGPSDHTSFVLQGIPSVHFFGAAHLDYHKPTDTPDKLNYQGLRDIVRLTANLVEVLDGVPDSLTFQEPTPRSGHASTQGGKGARLGIIPDFGASDAGLGIRGVVHQTPAETAGLQRGDVIVRFGEFTIEDIQGLFQALSARSPGDTVEIEILRNGDRRTLTAVLDRSARD